MLDSQLAGVPLARRRPLRDPARVPGIDMRTREGRRHTRIADVLIHEFGADDPVRLRELAGLKLTAEKTQAAVIRGEACARADLIRLGNLIARKEAELRPANIAREALCRSRSRGLPNVAPATAAAQLSAQPSDRSNRRVPTNRNVGVNHAF